MGANSEPREEGEMPFDYDVINAGHYDGVHERPRGVQSAWHRLKFAHVRSRIDGRMGQRLLDYGCGPGTFAQYVAPELQYTGVDIARPQIMFAAAKYGVRLADFLTVEDFRASPMANQHFDFATSIEVIEHLSVEEGSALLAEIRRTLRPGGQLVLTTPNYHSHWPILEAVLSRASTLDYRCQHVAHYHRRLLAQRLTAAGFTNVTVDSFMHVAPFLAAVSARVSLRVFAAEQALRLPGGALLIATATAP